MKIIIGAGGTEQLDWVSLRQEDLDITDPASWARRFKPNTLEAIVAEHVFEHLDLEEGLRAMRLCYVYLRPGGNLRIAVPDGFHPDPVYVNWVRPGTGYNGDDHKVLYNYHMLCQMLQAAGFKPFPREFYDEEQRLHAPLLGTKRGYIKRSIRSFWAQILSWWIGTRYMSLVVDAVKPLKLREEPFRTRTRGELLLAA